MLCIPGIFVLPSSEGGWGERKTSGATTSFVVLGSSLLLGKLIGHVQCNLKSVHEGNAT